MNFYALLDIYSYVGFFLHFSLLIFYIKNFNKLLFNKKKIFLFLNIILILVSIGFTLKIKISYGLDEEVILFRHQYIGILLSIVFLYLIINHKNFLLSYKRIISRFLLFSILFLFYILWGYPLQLIDVEYPMKISYKLMYYQNFHLDEMGIMQEKIDPSSFLPGVQLIKGTNDHYYPIFPLLLAFLNYLFMILFKLFCIPFGSLKLKIFFDSILLQKSFLNLDFFQIQIFQFQRIVSSLLAFLTVILFYKFLKEIGIPLSNQKRLFYGILYALGSIHWSVSAMNLWQHTYIEFFNLILLIFSLRFSKKENSNYLFGIGILQGILFYIRPTTIFISFVFLLFILYYLFKKDSKFNFYKSISLLLLGYTISILPMAYLNLISYGNPIGGYFVVFLDPTNKDVSFTLKNYLNNLFGIFFSPNYGVFAFHPYFLVSLIFLFIYKKYKISTKNILKNQISLISFFIILLYWFFYSFNVQWTGFYNYGPRMFADILVYLFILFIFVLEEIQNFINPFYKIILSISYGIAFMIQLYGNFSLQLLGDWYCDVHRKRDYHLDIEKKIWDFKDILFLHKIWYRSQPVYKSQTRIQGEKICTNYKGNPIHHYLVLDREEIKKESVELEKYQEDQNLPEGDLLFYYYFFLSKHKYNLDIYLENLTSKEGEIRIYIKIKNNVREYKFVMNPGEVILKIPLEGRYLQEKISFFAFSKNYDKILLKEIQVLRY
ncbi:MAG: hypothetical protein ACK4UJ_10450 [Leptonema sp. (in: bacteria)]